MEVGDVGQSERDLTLPPNVAGVWRSDGTLTINRRTLAQNGVNATLQALTPFGGGIPLFHANRARRSGPAPPGDGVRGVAAWPERLPDPTRPGKRHRAA
jgi:hypothetical protein